MKCKRIFLSMICCLVGGMALSFAQEDPYDPALGPPKGSLVAKSVATIEPTEGMGSWYGGKFHGRPTASGEIFNKNDFTCAHLQLEFGTRLLVTDLWNDRQVVVRVNDRGPFAKGRIIDLSEAAAEVLDMKTGGVAKLRIEVIARGTKLGPYGETIALVGPQNPPEKTEIVTPVKPEGVPPGVTIATIQVAAYVQSDYAVRTFDRLKASGFSPEFEKVPDPNAPLSGVLIRIILRNIPEKDIEPCKIRLADLGFRDVVIRRETKLGK